MRIAIITLAWKRPHVFEIWAQGVKRIQQSFPEHEIIVSVSGSEGQKSRQMVEKHGFMYTESPNLPLGNKANVALRVTRKLEPDYVVITGSDNLMSNRFFEYLIECMEKGYDEIGNIDSFQYDGLTLTAHYFIGYTNHRKGEPVGSGRAVSKHILEALDYNLWTPSLHAGLDDSLTKNIAPFKRSQHYYRCFNTGGVHACLKTGEDLHPFKPMDTIFEINREMMLDELPELKEYYEKEMNKLRKVTL